jgi:hypothetical protein
VLRKGDVLMEFDGMVITFAGITLPPASPLLLLLLLLQNHYTLCRCCARVTC